MCGKCLCVSATTRYGYVYMCAYGNVMFNQPAFCNNFLCGGGGGGGGGGGMQQNNCRQKSHMYNLLMKVTTMVSSDHMRILKNVIGWR